MSYVTSLRTWLSWHYWQSGAGTALVECLGELGDDLADTLRWALRSALPSLAPEDALREIAYNRALDPPAVSGSFTVAMLRSYLAKYQTIWRHAGARGHTVAEVAGDWGLLDELRLLGITAEIWSWRDLARQGAVTAFGGDSGCWYLKIAQPNPFGDPGLWDGGEVWDGGARWDYSDPTGVMPAILRTIDKFSPAGSSCRFIEIDLPTAGTVRIPRYEWWEKNAQGHAVDYYNTRY